MKIRQTKRHGQTLWELDMGRIDGQRRRLFFKKRKAARLKMAEMKSDFDAAGRRWTNLPPAAKAKIIAILDEIEAKGLTLDQVWDAYKSGKVSHMKVKKLLSKAIEEVLEAKKAANRRPAYLAELGRYLRLFARGRESMNVADFGVVEIE